MFNHICHTHLASTLSQAKDMTDYWRQVPAGRKCSLGVIRWEKVSLEGLPAIPGKADFGGNATADEHDM